MSGQNYPEVREPRMGDALPSQGEESRESPAWPPDGPITPYHAGHGPGSREDR